jgi:hypothetical protein
MKTIKLFVVGLLILVAFTVQAQVSVNINLGSPPPWGPVGYTEVQYYYLPDVEAYYDVKSSMFIYYCDGIWVHRNYLPYRYRNYDLYNGYKVVMHDYRGNTPYQNHNDYRMKYAKGYRGPAQKTIGNRPGNGQYKAKYHSKQYDNQRDGKNDGNNRNSKKDRKNNNGNGKKK